MKASPLPKLAVLCMALLLIGLASTQTVQARYLDAAVLEQGPDLFQGDAPPDPALSAAWQQYQNHGDLSLLERQVADATGSDDGRVSFNFLDWLTGIFDWFNDTKDEVTGQQYDDAGIPHDAFTWSKYGMNLHDINTMSVGDWEKTLNFAGPWVRFTMSTDEVSENNWYRLAPGLSNLGAAAGNLGISPKVVINLSGYSSSGGGSDPLLENLGWTQKAERYQTLAQRLVNKTRSLGWNDVIYEAWNEPDHSGILGIGPSAGSAEFNDGLSEMLNSFSTGVHSAGGTTAFSPFMSLNDSKLGTVKVVWNRVQSGFDYYSAHQYDDTAGKVKYWAQQTKAITGDRPVIITEHGYQNSPKDYDKYRRQAWALDQGFGSDVLKGVMGYVYASGHTPWVIDANEDFFWKVTHDSKP